ncbi:hypothetical protein Tco_1093500 [Tanacetum coccineum]|uniref:Reverse transcriptase domain-containing protein n=1 Tax=Tanacetum coccineum TaxID=301880 RepID=A0ABQ5ICV1_9ASTR
MSTSSAHQQSLADVGSETHPPMLERGSYISWASRFRRYLNRKRYVYRKNRKKTVNTGQTQTREYKSRENAIKDLTKDPYDELFDHLQQYEKLVIASRAKKLEKTHDPLALVAHTSSSSRSPPAYYVTHPPSVVDNDDEYHADTFQNDPEESLTNQAVVQADKVNIQSRNVRNDGRIARRSYNVQEEFAEGINVHEESHYARNCPKPRVRDFKYFMEQMLLAKKDEARVILSNKENNFLIVDAAQMDEIEELSPSYNSAFISEVQTPSTSYINLLFASNHEQTYYEQPKIINSIIGVDQINSNIIFDDRVEHDKNAHDPHDNELEQLARNAYKEVEKQQIIANKVKQQNVKLTKQAVQYKEKVWVFETTKENKTNFHKEFIEANRKAKHKYLDDVLNLEAKLKKNEHMVIKMSNSVQALFMIGPKPLSIYDPQLKHGLGYENSYTLKKAISQNPKLYDASNIHSSKVHVNICDTEEILEDATKSQIKMENKLKDLIAIKKKQNFRPVNYGKLNDLYEIFVP